VQVQLGLGQAADEFLDLGHGFQFTESSITEIICKGIGRDFTEIIIGYD
jgi:hypothetical protein